MRNRFLLPVALLAAAAGCERIGGDDGGRPGAESDGPIVVFSPDAAIQGEIIVKMKASGGVPSKSSATVRSSTPGSELGPVPVSGSTEVDRILMDIGTVSFERLFPSCGRFEKRTADEGMDRWFIVKYDETLPVSGVAQMLSGCDGVEVVEYSIPTVAASYSVASMPDAADEAAAVTGSGDAAAGPAVKSSGSARNLPFPFNESLRSQRMQWHYNNPGNVYANSTVVGADANVYAAWQLCTGNPDVIVAVIDQGVKYDHEDLADNMWVNTKEIPGNGIDDDGNGYVDDIYGFNFTDNKGELTFSADNMHGTHVAGTIAAVNNNGIGVNGIAGGSGRGDGVRIMSCETLGASESGNSGGGLGAQVRAIKYAADNGAVICQNSWGYASGALSRTDWTKGGYSALAEAIRYFVKYAGMDENGEQEGPMAGGIVIFAAGNDASGELCYPASDKNVVSVAATSWLGTPSYYTNYGKWVSISAPGGDLTLNSTYGGVYSTSIAEDGSSSYAGINGTSMACPHVSGACALAVSLYYGAEKKKGLTCGMLKEALLSSVTPVDPFCGEPYFGNMGVGSLDTWQLLLAVQKVAPIPDITLGAGEEKSVNLADYFYRTDVLVWSVTVPGIAEVSLREGILTVRGVAAGGTAIRITDGNQSVRIINVTVK